MSGNKSRKSKRKSVKNSVEFRPEDISQGEIENGAIYVRKYLKQRLLSPVLHEGLGQQFKENQCAVSSVLKQCIEFGESNSVVIVGPRQSGKTKHFHWNNIRHLIHAREGFVENVEYILFCCPANEQLIVLLKLVEIALKEFQDSKHDDFFIVRLNGYVQTDDRSALQEMCRQLNLDNVIDDHVVGSFAENLAFTLEAFQSGNRKAKPIIMVLDEFDLFAQHKNQSLIYNLLDVARSKNAPISIIGVTCRLDVMELLEKRVKSRFSHRSISTFSNSNFTDYLSDFRELLTVSDAEEHFGFVCKWNKSIKELNNLSEMKTILKKLFSLRKEMGALTQLIMLAICRITPWEPFLSVSIFHQCFNQQYGDSKAAMLHGVSVLELCLLIAMKHVTERKEGTAFNFEMVYQEYSDFIHKKVHTVQRFNKNVTMKAFEHLQAIEFVRPIDGVSGRNVPKEYRSMVLLLEDSHITSMIKHYEDCPTELLQWATSMYA